MDEERPICECEGCAIEMEWSEELHEEGETGGTFCPECKKAGLDKCEK